MYRIFSFFIAGIFISPNLGGMKKLIAVFVLLPVFLFSVAPDFSEFARRAENGERLCVAFFGGSLTVGANSTDPWKTSYRAIISRKLEDRFPMSQFRFIDAALGGTGSQLAVFRLDRDVLAYEPDLVFLDFTINDKAFDFPNPARLAAYEAVVRRLVLAGIPVLQARFSIKKDGLPNPPPRPLDAEHKKIAEAYGLPQADAVALLKERVATGIADANELWDTPDSVHPGDAGYALYADAVWDAFEQAISNAAVCRAPEKMLHAETYVTANRFHIAANGDLPDVWTRAEPHRIAIAFDFLCSRWMGTLAVAAPGAKPLRFRVRASEVMLFGESTKKSGAFSVRINGEPAGTFNANCADGNMRLVKIIASGMDAGNEWLLEIVPELSASEELRIESICAAGFPASVAPEN